MGSKPIPRSRKHISRREGWPRTRGRGVGRHERRGGSVRRHVVRGHRIRHRAGTVAVGRMRERGRGGGVGEVAGVAARRGL